MDNGIVFYYSYREFRDNYASNFKKWQELYPDGEERDFRSEYMKIYLPFAEADDCSQSVEFILPVHFIDSVSGYPEIVRGDSLGELIIELQRETEIRSREDNSETDTAERRMKMLEEIEESLKRDDLFGIYENDKFRWCVKVTGCNFSKIRPLLFVNDNLEVTYNLAEYKNFQFSVIRISEILMGYKTQERGENGNEEQKELEIDLSDTIGTEKIIMLEKTGVLDYLREQQPFNVSTNALASLISGFTGISKQTVQSYLNPMYSSQTAQKNNPMKSTKTVARVVKKFNSIGYKPQK